MYKMSGIFGVISKNDKHDNVDINNVLTNKKQKIMNTLSYRGNNSNGEWVNEKCYFLHTFLKVDSRHDMITQPFECDGIVVLFSGEICNYNELKMYLKEKKYISQRYHFPN